jgi:sugar lactone lactonase YvrE
MSVGASDREQLVAAGGLKHDQLTCVAADKTPWCVAAAAPRLRRPCLAVGAAVIFPQVGLTRAAHSCAPGRRALRSIGVSGGTLLLLGWMCAASLGAVIPRRAGAQATGRAKTARTLWEAANRAAAAGRPDEYRRLMASAVGLAPQHPGVLYPLARAAALTGRTGEALSLLERVAAMGFAGFDAADTAFRSLATRPAFARAAARLAANRQPVIASDTAFTVAGPDRIPENLAFDPRSGSFFLGSMAERTVIRVRPGGAPVPFAGPEHGLLRVVGMKADPRRRRLWVATWAPVLDRARLAAGLQSDTRLFAFDLASGRRLLMLSPRDTTRSHAFNDLVVTPAGDVYVTDNDEASVYRVRAGVDTLERIARPDPSRFNGANGIALAADGTRLYVAFAEGIARVDPASGRVRYLAVPPTVTTASVDGLYWHDGDLVAVQMEPSVERVVRFVLDPTGWRVRRAEVLERAHPAFRYPTTGVVVGDTLYYVANPGWDRLEDDGTVRPAEVPAPTVILRLPLH